MSAKTVVITGGNSGLGLESAKQIAASSPDWHVVIAGRDIARSSAAATELRTLTGNPNIIPMSLDLGALSAVREFADELANQPLPPLQALVCNAGLQVVSGLSKTVDGIETTFAVNHLGHFLLVNLVIDKLVPPARIVVVSSDTHDPAQRTGMPVPRWVDPRLLAFPEEESEAPKARKGAAGRQRYTTSKLCNVLFAYELAHRIAAARPALGRITVNAFNPGFMPGSGLARDYSTVAQVAWRRVLPTVARLRGHAGDIGESGEALARLVIDPDLEQVTGAYYDRTKPSLSSVDSYDTDKAAELWAVSAEIVGLKPDGAPLLRDEPD